jgi:uncharacterized protein YecT (DUF1311 family)
MDQMTMNECAQEAFKRSDSELNALYKDLERRLKSDPQAQKLLISAERAWVAFRDAECTFSTTSSIGGSIHPMAYSGCLDRLTKARIGDLKRYLQCDEGDLSCPLPGGAK